MGKEKRAKLLRKMQKEILVAAHKLEANGMGKKEAATLALSNVAGIPLSEAKNIVSKAVGQ